MAKYLVQNQSLVSVKYDNGSILAPKDKLVSNFNVNAQCQHELNDWTFRPKKVGKQAQGNTQGQFYKKLR